MAKAFNLSFTNGVAAAQDIEFGSYTLDSSQVPGYSGTLTPTTLDIPDDIENGVLNLTLKGAGTLTLTLLAPDNTTPVADAVLKRYISATDTTAYLPQTGVIDDTGKATGVYVISGMPFTDTTGFDVFLSVSSAALGVTDHRVTLNLKTASETATVNVGVAEASATLGNVDWQNSGNDLPISGTVSAEVA